MKLDDYLQKNESVVADVRAYDSKNAVTEKRRGTLAVTPNRVVFVRDKAVSDISLNGVNSIEYRAPSYPAEYLYWGFGLICLSLLSLVLAPATGAIPSAVPWIVFFSGVAILFVGIFLQRGILTLHTANSSFEFVSKDGRLTDIAHALRGYESR